MVVFVRNESKYLGTVLVVNDFYGENSRTD